MGMSMQDAQDVLRELEREHREDEIRQRLLGPIGQRPQEPGPRKPLRRLVTDCILKKAEEINEHAQYNATIDRYVIDSELMGELSDLLDDYFTILEEGW